MAAHLRALTPRGQMRVMSIENGRVLCREFALHHAMQTAFALADVFIFPDDWAQSSEDYRAFEVAGHHWRPARDWCGKVKLALRGIEKALNVPLVAQYYQANDLCGRASDRERLEVA